MRFLEYQTGVAVQYRVTQITQYAQKVVECLWMVMEGLLSQSFRFSYQHVSGGSSVNKS